LIWIKSGASRGWHGDQVHGNIAAIVFVAGCSEQALAPDATQATVDGDATTAGCLRDAGPHRLFVQGHGGTPRADGRYPLLHDHRLCDDRVFADDTNGDGVWQPGEEPYPLGPPDLVHGEHFLVGAGAYAEFAIELCADLNGDVALYIPNYDEVGSRTLHQVLAGGTEIGRAIDDEAGQSGYNPFVRLLAGVDPAPADGDLLILRSTNLSGVAFSVMVWNPPSEYESWIRVVIP
jgi:hypothetical protein